MSCWPLILIGFMLSNGPGDPAAMPNEIALTKEIVNTDKPVFGICLGHQILGTEPGIEDRKDVQRTSRYQSPDQKSEDWKRRNYLPESRFCDFKRKRCK